MATPPRPPKLPAALVREVSREEARRRFGTTAEQFARAQARAPEFRAGAAATTKAARAADRRAASAQAAPKVSPTFEADLAALQQGNADAVKSWRDIGKLTVRLRETGDPANIETANALMWSYGDRIKPHVDAIDPEWWDRNWSPPEGPDTPWYGAVLRPVGEASRFLDQWGQAALSGLAGITYAVRGDDEISAGEGLRHAGRSALHALDPTRVVPDRWGGDLSGRLDPDYDPNWLQTPRARFLLNRNPDQDDTLNLREAVGRDPNSGGRLLGAVDLLGTVALDPTTYVTLGQTGMARLAMRSAEDAVERSAIRGLSRTTVQEMNQRIVREGFRKGLSAEEKVLYRRLLELAADAAVEAGGSRTTGRVLKRDLVEEQVSALERGGRSGLRLAGTTVLPTAPLGDVARARGILGDVRYATVTDEAGEATTLALSHTRGLAGRVVDSPFGAALASVKPRLRLGSRQGREVAEAVGELASRTRANADALTLEIEQRLGVKLDALNRDSIMTRSIDEVGDHDTWTQQLNTALTDPTAYDEIYAGAGPVMRAMLDTLDDVRTVVYEATLRVKGYTEEQIDRIKDGTDPLPSDMHDINTYVPRIIVAGASDDAVRAIRNLSGDTAGSLGDAGEVAVDGTTLGPQTLQARTLFPEVNNVLQLNRQVRAMLAEEGIEVDSMFHTNMPAAWALSSRRVFEEAADLDLLEGLVRSGRGRENLPLAVRVPSFDEYKEAIAREGGEVEEGLTATKYMRQQLLEAGGKLGRYREAKTQVGATYFVLDDVAAELENVRRVFAAPRELGDFRRLVEGANNVWAASATVAGVNPGYHARNQQGNLTNMFYGGFRNPKLLVDAASAQIELAGAQEIMRQTGATLDDALAQVATSDKHIRWIKGALETGVLSAGRTTDLLRNRTGESIATQGRLTAGQMFSPRDSGSIINITGARMAEALEGNARFALYIDQLMKGASPAQAAAHVKKYLFDYDDLTRFEAESLRLVSRFYTYTRKNLGLHLDMMSRYPAGINQALTANEGLASLFPTDGAADPELGGLEFGPPSFFSNPIIGRGGGTNLAAEAQTPLAAALDTAVLLPRIAAVLYGDQTGPLDVEGPGERLADSFEALLSGFPVSVVNFARETNSREDSFTGRPLGDQGRDRLLFRLVETLHPAISRIEAQGARMGLTRGGDAEVSAQVQVAQHLLGLSSVELGEETDSTGRYLLTQHLADLLTQSERDRGVNVPTIDDLREEGRLAVKDSVIEALMYSWVPVADPVTGRVSGYAWSDDQRTKALLSVVPKDIRDLFPGAELPVDPDTGEELRAGSPGARPAGVDFDAFDLKQAIRAIETWRGTPLTDEERVQVVLASPWAPSNTQLQELGIQPVYGYESDPTRNRFAPRAEREAAYEEELAKAQAKLDELGRVVGLSPSRMAELRPRMSEMARVLDEARRAGLGRDELIDYVILAKDEGGGGVLSRADKAAINQLYGGSAMSGPVPITTTRNVQVTADDLRKMQTRGWQAEQELTLFAELYGLPAPTVAQREQYVLNALMTKGEQRELGLATLRGASNRRDVRTDEQSRADSEAKRLAGVRGIELGPGGAGTGEWFEDRFELD